MKKQAAAPKRYEVVMGIEDDNLGKRHEPGEIVSLEDWPAEVIAQWLEAGVIVEAGEAEVTDEPEG